MSTCRASHCNSHRKSKEYSLPIEMKPEKAGSISSAVPVHHDLKISKKGNWILKKYKNLRKEKAFLEKRGLVMTRLMVSFLTVLGIPRINSNVTYNSIRDPSLVYLG